MPWFGWKDKERDSAGNGTREDEEREKRIRWNTTGDRQAWTRIRSDSRRDCGCEQEELWAVRASVSAAVWWELTRYA